MTLIPSSADLAAALTEAELAGREAAHAAATWVADGNTDPDHVRRLLALIDAGDPEADDYLPARPNLSGEYADAPTPQTVAVEALGLDWSARADIDPEVVDALAEAWETGVDDAFEEACATELRRWAPDAEEADDAR